MNKKLMAVAVAGALAAPGLALAQASTSGTNVQIYGVFDQRFSLDKFSANTAGTISELKKYNAHGFTPNRLGFRGTESLGAGLSAFFQVETQVFMDARPDTGNANATNAVLGGRPTYVGIRGGWGEVSVGYQDSVYKDAYSQGWSVVPTMAHFGVIMNNGNTTGTTPSPNCNAQNAAGVNDLNTTTQICSENEGNGTAFNRTVSNTIAYRSPVISGLRFGTIMSSNEFKEPSTSTPAGTNESAPMFSAFSLTWAGGPFAVAAAYEQHVGFRAINVAGANRAAKDNGMTIGARYNYGRGLIGAGAERLKYADAAATAATANGFELTNWVVNGTFNVTPSDIISAGYSKTSGARSCGVGLSSVAVVPTCGEGTGSKAFTLTYDHNFSKRTAVYAAYGRIDNNSGATYYWIAGPKTNNRAGTTGGLAAGTDTSTLGIGIKHTF
jgi:predicted porin